jgi:hypothetical protein
MRIQSLLLGMLLLCSIAVLPICAQDDVPDCPQSAVADFEVAGNQSISIDGDTDDAGTTLDAAQIQAELDKIKSLYIIIPGRYGGTYTIGNVVVIICYNCPNRVCARIRNVASAPAD